jgi:hypothetical protein
MGGTDVWPMRLRNYRACFFAETDGAEPRLGEDAGATTARTIAFRESFDYFSPGINVVPAR